MLLSDMGEGRQSLYIIHDSSVCFSSGAKSKPSKHVLNFGIKFILCALQPLYLKSHTSNGLNQKLPDERPQALLQLLLYGCGQAEWPAFLQQCVR